MLGEAFLSKKWSFNKNLNPDSVEKKGIMYYLPTLYVVYQPNKTVKAIY